MIEEEYALELFRTILKLWNLGPSRADCHLFPVLTLCTLSLWPIEILSHLSLYGKGSLPCRLLLILADPKQVSLLTWHFHQSSPVPCPWVTETLSISLGCTFHMITDLFTHLLHPLPWSHDCHVHRAPTFWPATLHAYVKPLNKLVCTEEETKVKDKCILTFSETKDRRTTWASHNSKATAFFLVSRRTEPYSLLYFWSCV